MNKEFEKLAKEFHKKQAGKIKVDLNVKLENAQDLSLAYTPGVATICNEIKKDYNTIYDYTMKSNTVGIITNGTAVLGLGDIGPDASLPVMEGKAILLKKFANINAFPICINTKDSDEFVNIVSKISTSFGAINLEDIKAPECFYIEEQIKKKLNIPIFHDDRHGTAITILAALINCCRLTKTKKENLSICFSGLGSAGLETAYLLNYWGIKNIYGFEKVGVLNKKNLTKFNKTIQLAVKNNILMLADDSCNTLNQLLINKKIFIGLSAGNLVQEEDIKKMKKDPWIFPMANPTPEINPLLAKKAKAYIVGSGSNLYPNQVNNALVFPGILKAALQLRNCVIDSKMKIIAAQALANSVKDKELSQEYILPSIFNKNNTKVIVENILKKWKK